MNTPVKTTAILRQKQVTARTGLARSTIYLRMTQGDFPKPIHLGLRAVGWVEVEVEEWLQAQVEASRKTRTSNFPHS